MLLPRPDADLDFLRSVLNRSGLGFGSGAYTSPISCDFATVSASRLSTISRDLGAIRDVYRLASRLFLQDEFAWIGSAVTHGHSGGEIAATERTIRGDIEARLSRIDYVGLPDDTSQIAEVQWKSGGPGGLIGHERAFAEAFGHSRRSGEQDLIAAYLSGIYGDSPSGTVAVNEVRSPWLPGEQIITDAASAQGYVYTAIDRSDARRRLDFSGRVEVVHAAGRRREVRILRLRGLTAVLSHAELMHLLDEVEEGRLWLECPPNVIYRQKWPLALAFMPEFAASLGAAREALIPTALMCRDRFDLSVLVDAFGSLLTSESAAALTAATRVSDLIKLPTSVRSRIVLKCAAGAGARSSGGAGVFRLSGSSGQCMPIAREIQGWIDAGEPWIAQPYIKRTQIANLAPPQFGAQSKPLTCHARTMAFAGDMSGETPVLHGLLVNLSPSWKVAGAAARQGPDGHLSGTAFVGVEVGDR